MYVVFLSILIVKVAVSVWPHGVREPPLLRGVTDAVGVPIPIFGVTVGEVREIAPEKPALDAMIVEVNVVATPGTKPKEDGLAVRTTCGICDVGRVA